MGFHLSIAPTSSPLVEVLADGLSRPLTDPFATEVVAVPGDGVRAWLSERLATRLGATGGDAPDGILANVEFVFPAALVRRALGTPPGQSPWSVGPLTWAVHQLLTERSADFGVEVGPDGVDAVRCRAIADLFDRYALHRPGMVGRWEAGAAVDHLDRELDPHLRWQPSLWQALFELLGPVGGPTEMARAAEVLRAGELVPDLPERVFLVGLASLPPLHLDVLAALAQQIDVHVLAPTWSHAVWSRVVDASSPPSLITPVDRATDPSVGAAIHPLGATWGRAAREAQYQLARTARLAGREAVHLPPIVGAIGSPLGSASGQSLLGRIQFDLRDDRLPPGPADEGNDQRPILDAADRSVWWHRCHGPARQAEVVRDVVLHLLQETDDHGMPRFEPRDIALLCADPATYAPLIEAAFAGDAEHGVAPVPLRVADRSLRSDTPLLDAVGALLELLDGRFRVTDVLAFASLDPVARRFGLGADALEAIVEWVRACNVRWGLDAAGRARFGLPDDLRPHSWQAGLDQLAVGAAMADRALCPAGLETAFGPGDTVPALGLEGDEVAVLGALADLVDQLHCAAGRLEGPLTVDAWGHALAGSVRALCSLDDSDAWQWQQFDRLMDAFVAEAVVAGTPSQFPVTADQLAVLLSARLTGRPGRVRFGTGAVTMSSLTAQRGVPHRVICLVGIDGDLGASTVRSDDLTALYPCVGDRDARSEFRAQLLDAVISAGERLVITSTGHDLRTNADIPPAVPLAELADLIDATVRTADPDRLRASDAIAVDHPRHAWSHRCFQPDTLGVAQSWSFDRGALAAARRRLFDAEPSSVLSMRLPAEEPGALTMIEIEQTLRNPVKSLLAGRLGVSLPDDTEAIDAVIPLSVGGLDAYRLRERLLTEQLSDPTWSSVAADRWVELQRRSGNVPPFEFGGDALDQVATEVDSLLDAVGAKVALDITRPVPDLSIDIVVGGRRLVGSVAGVHDHTLVEIHPSRLSAAHRLLVWFHLLVLGVTKPGRPWQALVVGLGPTSTNGSRKTVSQHLTLQSEDAAREALETIVDLHERARRSVVPALPDTTDAIHQTDRWAGATCWQSFSGRGDGDDPWVRLALGQVDYGDLLDIEPHDDESGPGWSTASSRLERWAHRLWGAWDASVRVEDPS